MCEREVVIYLRTPHSQQLIFLALPSLDNKNTHPNLVMEIAGEKDVQNQCNNLEYLCVSLPNPQSLI